MKLTIAIPAKNEERNIGDCLNSIGQEFASRVVVLDSSSSDKTKDIALNWGAEVLDFVWNGQFPKKRNWFLMNYIEVDEWVLFLDADERLTPIIKTEILKLISHSKYSGYWIPYTIYLNNKLLKFGYPLKKLALIKGGTGFYEKTPYNANDTLDMEIHEHPILIGKTGVLKNKIEHKVDFLSENWKTKHIAYAKWEANRFLSFNKNENKDNNTLNQKIKNYILQVPLSGIFFFFISLVYYLGMFDGLQGIRYASAKAWYFNRVSKEIVKTRK